jgi:MoaA/NifB/PqqE/SkfB family radical SAM enzyme
MVVKSKTFCLHPFTHIEVANDGSVAPCCNFDRYYRMDNGADANITDSFDEIVNSQHSLELKKSLLAGQQYPGCHRCWRDEQSGLASQRERYNRKYMDYCDQFTQPSQFKLLSFDLKLGNTCNQMCVICNPGNSSMIQSEYKIRFGERKAMPGLDWYRHSENMEKIESQLDTILHIDFFGGEPWLIKQQWDILRKIIALGRSHEVTLNYATNGSLFQEEFFTIFSKFKSVSILFSADGIEDTFEYNRYPAKWDIFKDNLIKSLSHMNPKLSINIAYTVSIYSIFNVIDSLKYYKSISTDTNKLKVWLNIVNDESFNIKNLPDDITQSLIKHLTLYQDQDWPLLDKQGIKSLIFELNRPRHQPAWEEFIIITQSRDTHRKQSISSIIPEILWTENL